MLKKYNEMSKKIDKKGVLEQYTVNYINDYTEKYFDHILTKEEILAIANGVVIGKIKTVEDYPLFKKILITNPNLNKKIKSLLYNIILATSNYNFNIYKNAYLTYEFRNQYNKLYIKQQQFISNKPLKIPNSKINNGNIFWVLYQDYNIFLKNIFNSQKKFSIRTLNYYIDYSNIYFGKCNIILTILKKLYNNKIKITKYSTNQLYDLFKSYLEKIRKEINGNNFDNFQEFIEIYSKLRSENLGIFNEEIVQLYNYGVNKIMLLSIKEVFSQEKTLSQVCRILGKNKDDLLKQVKEIDIDIYEKLITLDKNNKIVKRKIIEDKYNYFINNMKIVSNYMKPENFTPIYYYSLTDVNIIEMIFKLGNNGQLELMNYLNNAYYNNQRLYEKVKMSVFREEIGDKGINAIAKIIKEEGLPKCYGVISYLVNLYNEGILEEFKKDYIKGLILNEEKRK